MFHQGGGGAVFSNEVYKARHNGVDNPNVAALKELHEAGVELRVCGQGLIGKKVAPSQLLPGVQADLWAMVTMVNLQSRGVRPRRVNQTGVVTACPPLVRSHRAATSMRPACLNLSEFRSDKGRFRRTAAHDSRSAYNKKPCVSAGF